VLVLASGKWQSAIAKAIAALYLVALLFICGSLFLGQLESPSSGPARAQETFDAVYHVNGTADSAVLTCTTAQGGIEQRTVEVPWTSTQFDVTRGQYLSLIAVNEGLAGTISCEIRIDTKTWRSSTSDGAFAAASCSGVIGVE